MTEATPLNYPENTVLDTLNCVFEHEGNIRRRLGMDYEASAVLTTKSLSETKFQTQGVGIDVWSNVGGDGNLHFLIRQVDKTLYFTNLAATPLSTGLKSFTVSLSTFAAPAASDAGVDLVSFASGKGFLFVTGKQIKPFYIKYSASGDTVTAIEISILVRDFDGVDDSLGISEEPTPLSVEHSYNLKNQGWLSPGGTAPDPVTTYFASQSKYPGNNKQWWTTKNTSGDLDVSLLTKYFTGNTLAPRGHYLLDPFNKDRDTAAGLSGVATETVSNRPQSVEFFAGRVFYGGPVASDLSSHIYYSQIIEDEARIAKCYQEADPTSEDISDLIDTDGGEVVIPEVGNILKLKVTGASLLVFADNGVWEITGSSGSGFTPTNYSVSKIAAIGIIGPRTVVDVEGVPIWWSDKGIYTIGRNDVTDRIEAKSLSQMTIQTTYEDISSVSKLYSQGSYDPSQHKVIWIYNSAGADTNYRFKSTKIIELNTQSGAFSLQTVTDLASNTPYIAGIFQLPSLSTVTQTATVIEASTGKTAIDASSNIVVADINTTQGGTAQTKYLCIVPGSGVSEWTYSHFNNSAFFDWVTKDSTGITYSSYFDTGYLVEGNVTNTKQAPYIYTYSKRTETGYISDGGGGYTLQNPSSCLMQARWQWADNSNSSRFGRTQQIYKRATTYDDTANSNLDFDDGFPVVVSRLKVRGGGQSLHLRFEAESGKDFNLYGWAVIYSATTQP